MTQASKLMARLADRQFTGWTFQDLIRVLLHAGFFEVSRNGSHRTFKHPSHPKLFTVPEGSGELKKGYPRDALKRIEELQDRYDYQPSAQINRRLHDAPVED